MQIKRIFFWKKKKILSKNKTKYKINKRKTINSEQVSRESKEERKEFTVSRPTRRNSSELERQNQYAHQAGKNLIQKKIWLGDA